MPGQLSIASYAIFILLFSCASFAVDKAHQCMLDLLMQSPDATTVGEIKAQCDQASRVEQQPAAQSIEEVAAQKSISLRIATKEQSESNPFLLTAYKPNYLLLASYNTRVNDEPWKAIYPDVNIDEIEAKFQISFQARIKRNVLGGEIWGSYTQQSWWQVYNEEASAPFRETNYEPEIFLRWETDNDIFGFKNRMISVGFNHESNGRGELLSRSWNRIMAVGSLEKGNLVLIGRTWYRLPEDSDEDDNPDILEYMGYGDLKVLYKYDQQLFGMTLINNLRSHNKGGVQLDWTFPLTEKFKGYIQYYNGYGESLIDHDESVNRIGFGLLLNDWM